MNLAPGCAVGIDLGGTNIKGAVLTARGELLCHQSIPTNAQHGAAGVIEGLAQLVQSLLSQASLSIRDIRGIGIGIPGMIDTATGTVLFSGNLGWENVAVAQPLQECFGVPVRTANDASAAALGEIRFGYGERYTDAVLVTLGTGVGGGVVIGGRLFEGADGSGAELGHMVIHTNGAPCTCGGRGCLEAYASATALVREAKQALLAHPHSQMWTHLPDGDIEQMDAKIPFLCMDSDPVAAQVVDAYTTMLAQGIANIVNLFRPQAVLIGGGVSNQGERLLHILRRKAQPLYFGRGHGLQSEILQARLGEKAGVYGAAALLL